MRIVIAVHHFPPRYTGGAELRAKRTAAQLRDRGHDVRVICVEAIDAEKGKDLSFTDTTYEGLPVRRLSFDLDSAPDAFRWSYDNPSIGAHMREYLAQVKPDILHLISGYLITGSTLRAATSLQIRTVVTLTDFWFLCPRTTLLRSNGQLCAPPFDAATCARCLGEEKRRYRIPGRFAPSLMKAFWQRRKEHVARMQARMDFLRDTLDRVDAIISPSQFLRNLFIEAGVDAKRIIFSRQGRDFPHLTPEKLTKLPSEHLRVGYLGQIAPGKGIHVLFEAVRQMPVAPLTVKVYGDSSHFPRYARQLRNTAQADPRLTLAGAFKPTELNQVLRDLDVIVVPSLWYENSPNVILEAFAHHTPVIASNKGGMAELVKHEVNGLHFSVGDARDLIRQLQRIVDEPSLLDTFRRNIPSVRTTEQEIAELLRIYQSVTEQEAEAEKHG
jgi:glycosyltransferase involved in cell wall biosynthesis